jgi:hypothetical protein
LTDIPIGVRLWWPKARLEAKSARWPDDARDTVYDHPTWHYASRPIVRPATPNPPPLTETSGEAIEALELNFREAANPHATMADRAVALCWVMHVAADMHQPLHAASLYSAQYVRGDSGGNAQWILDPVSHEPESLHWFWDDVVQHDDSAASVRARARALEEQFARSSLEELRARPARAFAAWSFEESYAFAAQAYPNNFVTGASRDQAVALPVNYAVHARAIAERRLAVAGYRLADLLCAIAAEE